MKPLRVLTGLSVLALSYPVLPELVSETDHFRIYTSLGPQFARFIERNAEAYYQNMTPRYFPNGFDGPLSIVYSTTQAESRRVLKALGHSDSAPIAFGLYIGLGRPTAGPQPAVYMHRKMDQNTVLSGWGTLFHEITHHFIHQNYDDPPAWFSEGLASFLGEMTRVVKGQLDLGHPNPRREKILHDRIKGGFRVVDVKHILSLSGENFDYDADLNMAFARALFYWLHSTGALHDYLRAVREKGYALSVLERVVGKSSKQINQELLAFVETHCYPAAYVYEAVRMPSHQRRKNPVKVKELLLKALEIQPNDKYAQFELAGYMCNEERDNFNQCRELLKPLLGDKGSAYYVDALWFVGDTYKHEKKCSMAIDYYLQTLEYAEYIENHYWLFAVIGRCYDVLGDRARAIEWYKKFLEFNWDPESDSRRTQQARDRLRVLMDE